MKLILTILSLLFIVNFSRAQTTYLSHISILEVTDGSLSSNQHVIISDGKVLSISNNEPQEQDFDLVIDGTNFILMPGLAEMHAHIPPPSTSAKRTEDVLFLYLSNGITLIRGMLGDSTHLELRTKASSGDLLSPRIFTSSPSLNGSSVTSKNEAIAKVTKYKRDGYDFLKIHPGIEREVFDQVVITANEVGIPFAGHVPVDVGIRHALKSGYASVDHVDGFIEGLVPESQGVENDANGFFGYNFAPLADSTSIPELVALSKQNKVWIVPTQSLFERWFAPISAEDLLNQPEMQYMPPATRRNWLRVKNQYMDDNSFSEDQWKVFDELRRKLIFELAADGHGILMGSDAPQLFNVPGFSIHHEIDGMQNAGLSNLQIIQSGTINPAIFFGLENTIGKVQEGFDADLILLNANPMDNLDALQDIEGVFINGRFLSKAEIDLKLKEIAE